MLGVSIADEIDEDVGDSIEESGFQRVQDVQALDAVVYTKDKYAISIVYRSDSTDFRAEIFDNYKTDAKITIWYAISTDINEVRTALLEYLKRL